MRKPLVVLAEDEPLLRELFGGALLKAGWSVLVADNGESALDLITKQRPDAVLLDLLMPKLTGYDVLERLRTSGEPFFEVLPCIVISNSGQVSDMQRALDLGADAVLVKADFEPAQLVAKFEHILSAKQKGAAH